MLSVKLYTKPNIRHVTQSYTPSSLVITHEVKASDTVRAGVLQGQPIPGIKDVNDKPPNPDQAIGEGKMKPRPKPWERAPQVGPHP